MLSDIFVEIQRFLFVEKFENNGLFIYFLVWLRLLSGPERLFENILDFHSQRFSLLRVKFVVILERRLRSAEAVNKAKILCEGKKEWVFLKKFGDTSPLPPQNKASESIICGVELVAPIKAGSSKKVTTSL